MTDEIFMMTIEIICNHIHKKSTPTFIEQLLAESLDLIKRQQAEIEHLRETTKMIKAEAIKDFVHYFFDECVTFDNGVTLLVDKEDFDNLVKEMTEGSK